MLQSICFSAIILSTILCGVQSTIVSHCEKDKDAPLPEVEVVGCDASPCTFYINSTGVMKMSFNSPRYLEHIAPNAQAFLGPMAVPYPLDQKDACEGVTNTPCPLAEGEYIEYTFEMAIADIFPPISIVLEFSLQDLDRNKEAFECFRMDLILSYA